MQKKDYGIILSKVDYSESSIIIRIYTSQNGTLPFIYRGAKNKKRDQFKIYPLSIVEFEYGGQPRSEIKYLNSISTYVNISNCFFDPIKSSILFFLNEVLQKTLQDADSDSELLSFLIGRLKLLDLEERPASFHLKFLADYTKFLGCFPEVSVKKVNYFDLQEGALVTLQPKHLNYITGHELEAFHSIVNASAEHLDAINLCGVKRSRMLHIFLEYYSLQIESFGKCKTLEILETIFRD
ncbi:MAG: DNA repair protein RecO [Crocinitomicaceae bacterium]